MTRSLFTVCTLSIALLIGMPWAAGAPRAHAAALDVVPAVIDERGLPRDIMKATITITNQASRMVTVYPVVNDIDIRDGAEVYAGPTGTDLSRSLASWILFTRGGVELEPGETREIPIEIKVNLTARAGLYHAAVSFPEGTNRPDAETRAAEAPRTLVNVEVVSDEKESLLLRRFSPDKRIFLNGKTGFSFEIENAGNRDEIPEGEIVLYDRTGREVGAVPLNPERTVLAPKEKKAFRSAWENSTSSPGQYKALLTLRYGHGGERQANDTIFFWIVPWWLFGLIALVMSLGGMMAAYYVHRSYSSWHHARLRHALATQKKNISSAPPAGMLPIPPPAPAPAVPAPRPSRSIGGLRAEKFPHVVDLRHPRTRRYTLPDEA